MDITLNTQPPKPVEPVYESVTITMTPDEAVTLFCLVAKIGAKSLAAMGFDFTTEEQRIMRLNVTTPIHDALRPLAEQRGYGSRWWPATSGAVGIMHDMWQRR